MAGSFAFALYLTFTSALIDFNVARLEPEAEEGFAMLLGETMVYARRSYTMCLAMFMMAFTVRTTGAENCGQKWHMKAAVLLPIASHIDAWPMYLNQVSARIQFSHACHESDLFYISSF